MCAILPMLVGCGGKAEPASLKGSDPGLVQTFQDQSPMLTQGQSPMLANELCSAVAIFLKVPDHGSEKRAITKEQEETLGEGYIIAQEYWFEHDDDPWAIYLRAYAEARLYDQLPEGLKAAADRLPSQQSSLAKRLIAAKLVADTQHEFDEYFDIQREMWHDFKTLIPR